MQKLADAHRDGRADVALVGISASEKQRGGGRLDTFTEFEARMKSLRLEHLEILLPMFYWDICFWDKAVEPDETMCELETKIQEILFPTIPVGWSEYCAKNSLDSEILSEPRWANAKCDVLAFWSHAHYKRDIFVTSDMNFHKHKAALLELAGGGIETLDTAVKLLSNPVRP
jgi:hypothetical protein